MFVDGCRVVGNLPIQQLRNLTCDPGKPLIAKRRAKKAAEDECHRHRSGTDRKPSTALAVGPDKKNENKNPCSKENQRGPHVTCIIASHTRLRRSRPALLVSRKRVKICLLRPKAKLRLVSAAWFPIGVTSLRMRLTLRSASPQPLTPRSPSVTDEPSFTSHCLQDCFFFLSILCCSPASSGRFGSVTVRHYQNGHRSWCHRWYREAEVNA